MMRLKREGNSANNYWRWQKSKKSLIRLEESASRVSVKNWFRNYVQIQNYRKYLEMLN